MSWHDNRLLRGTVAGLTYLGPRPDCWLQRENNGESCLEKVVLTHMMGWPFVGKGFFQEA